MPLLTCSAIERDGLQELGLKLSLLQYMQPEKPRVPSLFGQVKPASTLTL
jgi:hypothetical protein